MSSVFATMPAGEKEKLLHANFYDMLQLSRTASTEDIMKHYRRAALVFHPDKTDDEASHRIFVRFAEAARTLADPSARKEYDATVGLPASKEDGAGALPSDAQQVRGCDIWEAMEETERLGLCYVAIKKASEIETRHGLAAGSLLFQDPLCSGTDCESVEYIGKDFKPEQPFWLCRFHNNLHACSRFCTTERETCGVRAVHLTNIFWTHRLNRIRRGIGEDELPDYVRRTPTLQFVGMEDKNNDHKCKPGCFFARIDDHIYVCCSSGNIHLCTPLQCGIHTKTKVPGGLKCWISKTVVQTPADSTELDSQAGSGELCIGDDLRVLQWDDKDRGHVVEYIKVPKGMPIGEAINAEQIVDAQKRGVVNPAVAATLLKKLGDDGGAFSKKVMRIAAASASEVAEEPVDVSFSFDSSDGDSVFKWASRVGGDVVSKTRHAGWCKVLLMLPHSEIMKGCLDELRGLTQIRHNLIDVRHEDYNVFERRREATETQDTGAMAGIDMEGMDDAAHGEAFASVVDSSMAGTGVALESALVDTMVPLGATQEAVLAMLDAPLPIEKDGWFESGQDVVQHRGIHLLANTPDSDPSAASLKRKWSSGALLGTGTATSPQASANKRHDHGSS